MRATAAIWPALGLWACGGAGEDCTLEARSSVSITVVDEAGEIIDDATVTFAVDQEERGACERIGDTWACGWEEEGYFLIEATAPGYGTTVTVVEVGGDECHVATEEIELVLSPL